MFGSGTGFREVDARCGQPILQKPPCRRAAPWPPLHRWIRSAGTRRTARNHRLLGCQQRCSRRRGARKCSVVPSSSGGQLRRLSVSCRTLVRMKVGEVDAGQGPEAPCIVSDDGYFSGGPAEAALARVAAAIDGFLAVDLAVSGTGGTLDLLRGIEVQARRLYGASVAVIGQIDQRGLAAPAGQTSTASLVRQVINVGRGDAAGRVRLSAAVCASTGLSGAQVEPALPLLAGAVATGVLGARHADLIVSTLRGFPAHVPADVRDSVEEFLVEQAGVLDPKTFQNVAREIALMADPDGTDDERNAHEKQEFHIGSRRPNGLTKVWGLLDDLTIEALRAAFGALGAPSAQRSPWDPPETPSEHGAAGADTRNRNRRGTRREPRHRHRTRRERRPQRSPRSGTVGGAFRDS